MVSIYASFPGLGNLDDGDDPAAGAPWVYQGSHILPDEDHLRGGHIGLALIPSHITRDGRDDQPEGGRPWPWLRLDVFPDPVIGGQDPALLLAPAQARHLARLLTAWADQADPGAHDYLSTGCLHGNHAYCQGRTGRAGAKKPGQCKFCAASCRCDCHTTGRPAVTEVRPISAPVLDDTDPPINLGDHITGYNDMLNQETDQ